VTDVLTRHQFIASLLAVVFASGCSNSATLTLRDGNEVQSKILRSDAETVWVEGIAPSEVWGAVGRDVVVELDNGEKLVGRLYARSVVVEVDDDEKVVGRLYARNWAEFSDGSAQWRLVCVRRQGDAPKRPFCVRGPEVEVTQMAIKRKDIADVSHPGTAAIVAGGLLLGLVGLTAVVDFSRPDPCESRRSGAADSDGSGWCFYGRGTATLWTAIVVGIPGLGLETYGLATHLSSRSRYAPPETSARPAPMRRAKRCGYTCGPQPRECPWLDDDGCYKPGYGPPED